MSVLTFLDLTIGSLRIKSVDIALFAAILVILLIVLAMVIVSAVLNRKPKKQDPKEENQLSFDAFKEESPEETKNEATEEPVAVAAEEQVAEEAVEEPVVEEATEEPVAEEKTEEPVVEEAVEEPVVEEAVEEPVAEEKAEEPVAEEKAEEPVAEEAVEEPVAEEKAEEPVAEEKAEEPVAEEKAEEPVVEEATEEPAAEEKPAKKPAAKKTTTKKAADAKEPAEKKTAAKKAPARKAAPKPIDEAEADENQEEAAGRQYNGKYEVFMDADGYRYCLKASNGEILVLSETYTTRDGVIKAIGTVKKNVEEGGDIKIFTDKHGKYKFKLTSKNFRVLVVSASYGAEKSANRAAESFKKFALKAEVVDVEVKDADVATATVIEIENREDKDGGKFVVQKYNGEFSWDLKASNGQILCQADGYTSKAGVMNSIEVFKKNVETGTFKCVKDKTNHYFYKLYSAANRVCAVGESYSSKQSAESAANSVVSFYKNAEIVEEKEQNSK